MLSGISLGSNARLNQSGVDFGVFGSISSSLAIRHPDVAGSFIEQIKSTFRIITFICMLTIDRVHVDLKFLQLLALALLNRATDKVYRHFKFVGTFSWLNFVFFVLLARVLT